MFFFHSVAIWSRLHHCRRPLITVGLGGAAGKLFYNCITTSYTKIKMLFAHQFIFLRTEFSACVSFQGSFTVMGVVSGPLLGIFILGIFIPATNKLVSMMQENPFKEI